MSGDKFEGQQELERSLMLHQIAQMVAEARPGNSIINARHEAVRLFAEFPQANLAVARIVDEIVHAAAEANVVIELGSSD